MRNWWWLWRRLRRSREDEWGQSAAPPSYDYAPAWGKGGPGPAVAGGPAGAGADRSSLPLSAVSNSRWSRRRGPGLLAKLTLILLLCLTTALFSLYQIDRRFRPALAAIAEMKAKAVASQAINEALADDVFGDIRYDQLMDVKMDPKGERVLLLQANGPELTRIAGRAQRQVWERLNILDGQSVRVPIAQALGWTLFANWGPKVGLAFHPTGATVTDIRQIFQSAGINQIQHVIYAHTEVTIRVLVPLVSRDVVVETNTFITAAVLNGEVPSFYMNGGTVLPQGQGLPPVVLPGSALSPGGAVPSAP
ncbi:MAG: sporulation protein YunB [Symbiobacteriia bacterium]